MDALSAICSRRSVRDYTQEAVPGEVLAQILEAARLAPSATNSQPWRFMVVTDPPAVRVIRRISPGMRFDAPVLIVICWRHHADYATSARQHLRAANCYLAAENIAISAHALGLGTCMIGSFAPSGVAEVLSLPDDVHPELIMTLGYPRSIPEPRPRLPLGQLAYLNQWGASWTE